MSDKELIAAARQPTESYREALDKIVTEYDMALYTKEDTLDRLSRAALPDAATEELDKVTLDRLQELAEERGYDKGFAAGWKSGGRTADLLAPKLRKAQAERDAALAALARLTVRKAEDANAFCIEHGNYHAVELGDPTCEFEDGFGEPVEGEKP